MMLAARGSIGQLEVLLSIVEYMKDPESRAKELKALIMAKENAEKAMKSLTRAHGGAKKIKEAGDALDAAEMRVSDIVRQAKDTAARILNEAEKKCGNLVAEHARLTQLANEITALRAKLVIDTEEALAAVKKRENTVARQEKSNAEAKAAVTNEQARLSRVNKLVNAELRS